MEVIVKVEDVQEDKDSSFLSLSCGYSDVKPPGLEVVVKEENALEDGDATLPGYSETPAPVATVKVEEAEKRLACPRQNRVEMLSRVSVPLELRNGLSARRDLGERPLQPAPGGGAFTSTSSPSNHKTGSSLRSQAAVLRKDYRSGERMWDHHEVSPNRARSRKPNLMEKLQEKSKLQKSKNSPQEEDVVYLLPGFGNKNAAKHTRLIEFGWMHNQKQVRSRNGGGTRRLIVPKNAGYEHLFKLGKDLFFPNGLSTKGPETDFIFNIRDFGGSEMPRGATVGALYEPLKHGMLRLYLCSLDRGQSEPEFQIKCESESESCNSEDVSSPGKQLGNFKRCDGGPCSASDFNCSYSNSAHEVLGYSQESYHLVVEASPSFKPRRHTPLDSNSSDSAHEVFGDFQESYPPVFEAPSFTAAHPQTPKRARWEPHQSSAPRTLGPHRTNTVHNTIDQFEDSTQESQQNSSLRTLRLRRPNIAHDMIKQFEDPDILDVSLSVSFVDESGIDTLGLASVSVSFAEESGIDTPSLAQEAYSSFWEAFLQTDAAGGGTLERVPALRPDYGKAEWEAVGRVLLKGFQDHGYFPTQLSRAFAVCLVLGEEELTPDMLIESFLRFTSPAERLILSSALEGREYSMDSLLDILHRMRVCTLPEGGTIADVILRMAHTRLVQEPMYALLRMASTARTGLRQLLPTASAVSALYPTHTQPRALLHEHSPAQHEFNSCTL